MLRTSIALRTITSSLGLQGTCLLIILISTLLLAVPLLSYGSKLFENFKFCLREVAPECTPISASPLPSGTSESILDIPYPTPVTESGEEVVDKDEGCIPELGLSEIGDPQSAADLEAFSESNLVNYNSYRHKLIEETLQKQYGGGYAPGNVILNLIELNTADSAVSVILGKKYERSFFDLIKIRDGFDVDLVCNRVEYPDQLAHFIPRNFKKPSTTEIHTETSLQTSEINLPSPITRPNTPTSCHRILPKRSRDAGSTLKSPFPTPVHSQAPIKPDLAPGAPAREIRLLEAPLTEQLYRRNEAKPDVVSKTHVEAAAEYLNNIAENRRYEVTVEQKRQDVPRRRSSLKKSKPRENEDKEYSFDQNGRRVLNDKTGDCNKLRRSPVRDDLRNLSSSKPTVWNN